MTHWKAYMNKEYLGSWDLPNGQDVVGTIKSVAPEKVIGSDGKKEECLVAHFTDLEKPMILNATNCKTIAKVTSTNYVEEWVGHRIQIGSEKVKAFGDVVDALRVRDKKVTAEKIYCEVCGKEVTGNDKLSAAQVAAYSKSKYGKVMCIECGKAQK